MNDIAMKPVQAEETDGDVAVVFDEAKALHVLTDPKSFEDFFERVKAAAAVAEPDVNTNKGRDEIRAAARKVVTTKTKIVATAKSITEGWRAKTAEVNKTRDAIEEQLAALAAEIRKPLTEWETAEKAREDDVKAKLADIEGAAVVTVEDTIENVEIRLQRIGGIEITDDHFGDYAAAARAQLNRTLEILRAAVARLRKEAEDRAELDRLRQADAERREKERLELEAAEAKAAADRAAEEQRLADQAAAKAEEQRQEQARAEAKVAADRAAADAEARARADAEARAKAEQDARDREHQAKLDEQRQATERAEAEARRLADEQAERDRISAEEARLAAERQADREHRGKVMAAAKEAIMAVAGIKEDAAKKVVLAIVAGEVPAVTLTF